MSLFWVAMCPTQVFFLWEKGVIDIGPSAIAQIFLLVEQNSVHKS